MSPFLQHREVVTVRAGYDSPIFPSFITTVQEQVFVFLIVLFHHFQRVCDISAPRHIKTALSLPLYCSQQSEASMLDENDFNLSDESQSESADEEEGVLEIAYASYSLDSECSANADQDFLGNQEV